MREAFQLVVLGCTGGPCETNLSGYLFSPIDSQEWIALDAGSLLGGIEAALKKGALSTVLFTNPNLTPAGEMLIKKIKAFVISHAHLDHILGLVLNSQVDEHKSILGIDPTIDHLRDHIFNGKIWPNYGSEGSEPIIHLYQYIRLSLNRREKIPQTSLSIEPFLLSHPHDYPSTAFLIEHLGQFFLYFGDTSSDFLEKEKHLTHIWHKVAPLIRANTLRGMMLECSYSHEQSSQVMFGHLDSHLMMKELSHLQEIAQFSLKGFKVLVTHRKETLYPGDDAKYKIQTELTQLNHLGIEWIFPEQGARYVF